LRILTAPLFLAGFFGVHAPGALAQTDSELRDLYDRKEYARIEQYARQGDARAEAWMGLIRGQAGRPEEAKEWYRRAAEKGNLMAIGHLARIYEYREKNYEEADRWYRRGAELGDQDMQVTLAGRYLHGQGLPRDEREAFRWYLAAANSGNSYAYLATARMYAAGEGTERDPIEGFGAGRNRSQDPEHKRNSIPQRDAGAAGPPRAGAIARADSRSSSAGP
jgi:TPR repeat protein